jgi:hypothetical protein
MNIIAVALAVFQELPTLIQAGQDVTTLIENTISVITQAQANGTDPTPDQWATLDASIKQLRSQI